MEAATMADRFRFGENWLKFAADLRSEHKAAFFLGKAAQGKNPLSYVRDYKSDRGMNWHRDVHDWLGGYPYESASATAVKQRLQQLGFNVVRSFERPAGIGLFGTGCDEYVGQRSPVSSTHR
jgi:2-polyprenyl-6-hydroxyphenyl methylase/3-demethylubiquinone-9 3-methyltransferase